MKRYLVLLIAFSLNNAAIAQLYVSNNASSYVFVADNYLFVKQDVNIQAAGNIYLRNESQLLQGSTASSTNSGTGNLSVFQEGTSNAYAYNYWCSPVGQSAGAGNGLFGITMVNRPTGLTTSTPATATHFFDYNGVSNPLSIEPWFVWKYIASNLYEPTLPGGWIQVKGTTTLNAGEGFTMKGTNGVDNTVTVNGVQNNPTGSAQRYDFRGKPNDGTIPISIGTGKWTLTGNPYPSAINLSAFLTASTSTTGIAYFWEHDKSQNTHQQVQRRGGYGTYSPVGGSIFGAGTLGIYVPAKFTNWALSGGAIGPQTGTGGAYERYFCPIGQGFMLEGVSNVPAEMKNIYRVFKKEGAANYSQWERNSSSNQANSSDFLPETPSVAGFDYTTVSILPTPQIKFSATFNDVSTSFLSLGLSPFATDNVDFAMDASSADETGEEVYFLINNNPYSIDVINFDINKRIPIGLRNNANTIFKIAVDEFINFYDADHVYIHDKLNDVYTEITNDIYEVAMPAGDNKTRFEITFMNAATALNNDNVTLQDFDVMQNNSTKNLTISNPKSLEMKDVSLFDLTGKLIFNKSNLGNDKTYQFSTIGLSDAIYVVKITTQDGKVQGKKISVFKSK